MTLVLLCGALAGVGMLWLVSLLDVTGSRSGAARLAELDAARRQRLAPVSLTVDRRHSIERQPVRRLGAGIRDVLDSRGVRLPHGVRTNLAVIGRSLEAHLGITLLCAAGGAAVPLLLFGMLAVLFPVAGGVAVVATTFIGLLVGALLPTLDVAARAGSRRRDFRHVVGSFLDLVAMSLAGGRGVPEALTSASRISGDWAMIRIRDTLEMARLHGVAPWTALGQLGEDMGIEELRDMAAALALVADDGAKVRDSLSARAASLRRRELSETEGRAQARSQSMLVAQLLLASGFLIFLIYPALATVLGS